MPPNLKAKLKRERETMRSSSRQYNRRGIRPCATVDERGKKRRNIYFIILLKNYLFKSLKLLIII
jgi:hypothetical protein